MPNPGTGQRRKIREIVFKSIFQYDFHKDFPATMEYLERETSFYSLDKESKERAKSYLKGIIEHLDEVDSIITAYLKNWTFDRLASIDRSVLRLGAYELIYVDDVPVEVTLNEAIEISKKYGSREDGKFVNGVLDKIAKERVSEEKRAL